MRYVFLGLGLAALAAMTPAAAQGVAPPAGQAPMAAQTSISNADFRKLALMAESFDYESSRLAIQQSARRSIRQYAASLMGNFRFHYARLSSGAGVFSGVPALPQDPNAPVPPFTDPRRAAMLNQLSTATGRDFDRLYLDMQLGTRQETIGLYQAYMQSGSDPALLTFARERLPLLQQQYVAVRRLAGR